MDRKTNTQVHDASLTELCSWHTTTIGLFISLLTSGNGLYDGCFCFDACTPHAHLPWRCCRHAVPCHPTSTATMPMLWVPALTVATHDAVDHLVPRSPHDAVGGTAAVLASRSCNGYMAPRREICNDRSPVEGPRVFMKVTATNVISTGGTTTHMP